MKECEDPRIPGIDWQQFAGIPLHESESRLAEFFYSATLSREDLPLSITIRKLSDLTGISIRHLYRMDAAGLIPGKFKCGRLSRYKFSVIKEWIRSGMDPNFTEEQADAEEFLFDQLLEEDDLDAF